MTILKTKKPRKSQTMYGNYAVEAVVKTEAGFQDTKFFYFETMKEAKDFVKNQPIGSTYFEQPVQGAI